jgi:hypothetical protein
MRSSQLAFVLGATVISSAFLVPAASASPTGNDPCKVLTAEMFSQIMGYTATINKTAPTQRTCFYQGPAQSGGQFMILTETKSGPQADATLNRRGAFVMTHESWGGGVVKLWSAGFAGPPRIFSNGYSSWAWNSD